jgi:hypothetical protein
METIYGLSTFDSAAILFLTLIRENVSGKDTASPISSRVGLLLRIQSMTLPHPDKNTEQ